MLIPQIEQHCQTINHPYIKQIRQIGNGLKGSMPMQIIRLYSRNILDTGIKMCELCIFKAYSIPSILCGEV